jgi:hypothetical protein
MSTQITIILTDDVYQKADRFARLANRDIASVLADTIQSSIPNISEAATTLTPISLLSDADVLALTELQTLTGSSIECITRSALLYRR